MKIPLYDNYDLSEYGVVTNTNTGKRVASFKNQKGYHRIALCREAAAKADTLFKYESGYYHYREDVGDSIASMEYKEQQDEHNS